MKLSLPSAFQITPNERNTSGLSPVKIICHDQHIRDRVLVAGDVINGDITIHGLRQDLVYSAVGVRLEGWIINEGPDNSGYLARQKILSMDHVVLQAPRSSVVSSDSASSDIPTRTAYLHRNESHKWNFNLSIPARATDHACKCTNSEVRHGHTCLPPSYDSSKSTKKGTKASLARLSGFPGRIKVIYFIEGFIRHGKQVKHLSQQIPLKVYPLSDLRSVFLSSSSAKVYRSSTDVYQIINPKSYYSRRRSVEGRVHLEAPALSPIVLDCDETLGSSCDSSINNLDMHKKIKSSDKIQMIPLLLSYTSVSVFDRQPPPTIESVRLSLVVKTHVSFKDRMQLMNQDRIPASSTIHHFEQEIPISTHGFEKASSHSPWVIESDADSLSSRGDAVCQFEMPFDVSLISSSDLVPDFSNCILGRQYFLRISLKFLDIGTGPEGDCAPLTLNIPIHLLSQQSANLLSDCTVEDAYEDADYRVLIDDPFVLFNKYIGADGSSDGELIEY